MKHDNVRLNLTNASGGRMRYTGCFTIRVSIQGRSLVLPFVVCPDMTNAAIIGMNVIKTYGMIMHPGSHVIKFDNICEVQVQ